MARILVIEDDPGTQLLLQSRLRDLGHEVIIASTGAMGVMEARSGGFDLFLVDVMLGAGIDGYEVCRRLKGMPHAHAVPVVLVSGTVKSREDLHKGYEAGCDSFLVKGDNTILEDVVRAMLRIKTLQDDLQLQNRLLDDHNRRLLEERRRGAEMETALRSRPQGAPPAPPGESTIPLALLVVDGEGLVRIVDRGAREMFGPDLEGRNLGSLAVGTGLEAFVRDARAEVRVGFRLDLPVPGGRDPQRLVASVVPVVPRPGHSDVGLKVVCLHGSTRASAADHAQAREYAIESEAVRSSFHAGGFVGESAAAAAVRRRMVDLAGGEAPVLIRGEEGSGRRWLARALHFHAARRGEFLWVDCATLGPESLERELFGVHEPEGEPAIGLLERAGGGTVLLVEVSLLPLPVQRQLAEALAEGSFHRSGDRRARKLRARLMAVTSVDLAQRAERDQFDRELYRRLAATQLQVPPLRERQDDIPQLAERFLERFGARLGSPRFSDDVLWVLQSYDWPGNVRELELTVERACRNLESEEVLIEHLPRALRDLFDSLSSRDELPVVHRRTDRPQGTHGVAAAQTRRPQTTYGMQALNEGDQNISLEAFEKQALLRALDQTGGDKLAAARLLKIGKSTLYRKLKRYDIK